MSPLLRKETRMLLPAWALALVTATMPIWPWEVARDISFFIFCGTLLLLALTPFGMEMSHGTFGLLLVQPEKRKRFWRVKSGLLAAALGTAWALFNWCSSFSMVHGPENEVTWATLIALLAFSGGLWNTLLLRELTAAFFCTLLTPMCVFMVTLAAVGHWIAPESKKFETILQGVLAAYAAAGFFGARLLFLRAQDVTGTSRQISLTVGGASWRWLAFKLSRRSNRWLAAVQKELQLQEVTMVVIPGLLLLHLAALAIAYFSPALVRTAVTKEFLHEVAPMLWMGAMPFMIGCAAVAEERRHRTLEGLLCLPMSKRASFTVKFVVALVLGMVLGGIAPWAVLQITGLPHGFSDFKLEKIVGLSAVITGFAFYASTMSRSLLEAIVAGICAPVVTGLLFGLCLWLIAHATGDVLILRSSLFFDMTYPIIGGAMLWLAFRNYKSLQIGWRLWMTNLIGVAAVFGCVALATGAVFERAWELFLPLEPHHGPARINGLGRAAMVVSVPEGFYELDLSRKLDLVVPALAKENERGGHGSPRNLDVVLPDGRLWIGKAHPSWKRIAGTFVSGTNWVKVVPFFETTVALKSDGTLWNILDSANIRRLGPASDWADIGMDYNALFAIKKDGTLWAGLPAARGSEASDFMANPIRVGEETHWTRFVHLANGWDIIVKRDGTLEKADKIRSNLNFPMLPWNLLPGTNWWSLAGVGGVCLGIRNDGSLWADSPYLALNFFGEKVPAGVKPPADFKGAPARTVRVGNKSDWTELSSDGMEVSALEGNGGLWTWIFQYDRTKRPSKYADWLVVAEDSGLTWALAKDGTLSCWNVFGETEIGDVTLGPTRRPVLSTNILGD